MFTNADRILFSVFRLSSIVHDYNEWYSAIIRRCEPILR